MIISRENLRRADDQVAAAKLDYQRTIEAIAQEREAARLKATADRADDIREQEAVEMNRRQAERQRALAMRAQEEDRRQAQKLIDTVSTDLFLGRSRDQLKTDVFMAEIGGRQTQDIRQKIQTDLFLGHSNEQLKTDVFMLNPKP